MFEVVLSNRFRKDLKLAAKRGLRLDELNAIVEQLAAGQTLPVRIPICLISRFKAAPPGAAFCFALRQPGRETALPAERIWHEKSVPARMGKDA